jgi:hypothetical protein
VHVVKRIQKLNKVEAANFFRETSISSEVIEDIAILNVLKNKIVYFCSLILNFDLLILLVVNERSNVLVL